MSIFAWSATTRTYQKDGEPVDDGDLRGWVAVAVEASRLRVKDISADYVNGKINHAEWVLKMRDEIRVGMRGMAQLALGGAVTRAMLPVLANAVKAQYRFLNSFALAVENGDVKLGTALVVRAQMYAQNFWSAYQGFVRVREQKAGMKYERLTLGSSRESCAECVTDALRGWVKVGTLKAIGSRICISMCRCHLEYANSKKATS